VPELPEVETIRRGLLHLIGRQVVRTRLRRADVCRHPAGGRCRPSDLLQGQTLAGVERCGKQLALIAGNEQVLVVQLGMTGQLRCLGRAVRPPGDHVHAVWTIDDGSVVIFRDPRRFGGLCALRSTKELEDRWSALGPDALAVTGRQLTRALGDSHRAIKAGLLDQRAIAGVGNIYADESLFRAGIRPDRLCTKVAGREYSRLAAAIRQTLDIAIGAGGSTLRDYASATGEAGQAQQGHLVYAKAGRPCPRCRRPLTGIRLAQRATVFCAGCQK
jgi:formamidopyrimidine-DNA glycosylase